MSNYRMMEEIILQNENEKNNNNNKLDVLFKNNHKEKEPI